MADAGAQINRPMCLCEPGDKISFDLSDAFRNSSSTMCGNFSFVSIRNCSVLMFCFSHTRFNSFRINGHIDSVNSFSSKFSNNSSRNLYANDEWKVFWCDALINIWTHASISFDVNDRFEWMIAAHTRIWPISASESSCNVKMKPPKWTLHVNGSIHRHSLYCCSRLCWHSTLSPSLQWLDVRSDTRWYWQRPFATIIQLKSYKIRPWNWMRTLPSHAPAAAGCTLDFCQSTD